MMRVCAILAVRLRIQNKSVKKSACCRWMDGLAGQKIHTLTFSNAAWKVQTLFQTRYTGRCRSLLRHSNFWVSFWQTASDPPIDSCNNKFVTHVGESKEN